MRLICPKCNAQYDVSSDAIPAGGRDVQCSSCSHTWFQTEKAPEAASVVTPAEPSRVAAEVENAVTKRKPLDSSIADILRQEAAREQAEANATSEAPAAEEPAQPRRNDPVAAEETRRRISMMAEEEAHTPAAVAAAATGAVSDDTNMRSVPSIDEINQQLRARSQSGDGANLTEAEQQEVVQRRGFRRGFAFILILIALAIAPYIFADQIVAQFPQVAEPMATYIEVMDNLRLWLNDQFQTVRGLIAEYTGSAAETAEPAVPGPAVESTAPAAPVAPSE
ncbi:zinc-ribbon domain-containing protein [Yoonia sp. I 8.24]|uniref:zinc-ribbon domain-containing protein n=1 Tax=Yoonia sp. I 8.24 TaxID=1537229 RepID=UPI001EDDE114|nr:zinc-ribbon domain-containing protein [Yoonia sp. I 8.24]MCG3269340.1 zinc-ribbon domain-containing protein [Yoonia sp. I 8.24]